MKQYANYKESGIEWLGEVPEHWDVKRLKYAAKISPDKISKDVGDDHLIRYVDIGNVNSRGEVAGEEEYRFGDAPSRARLVVQDGDTIVSTVRTYLKAIAYMDNPPDNRIVSTGFAVLRPAENVHPKFLGWLASSAEFVDTVVANSTGVSYPAINASSLAELPMWLPPLDEQRALADYLDRKTQQIDALVARKKRLIELLEERRTAVINRAVMKGLDPDAEMQDSGVAWLGEVPAHWEVTKLKFKAKSVSTGSTPPTTKQKYFENGSLDWFAPGDFGEGLHLESSKRKINELAVQDGKAPIYEPGTILLVGIGATVGKIGFARQRCSANQQINAIDFKSDYNSRFGAYYLSSISEPIISYSNSATLPIINQAQTNKIPVVVPPVSEQEAIVEKADRIVSEIDSLIRHETVLIEKLRELRTSLISEVVTGKIDVREKKRPDGFSKPVGSVAKPAPAP